MAGETNNVEDDVNDPEIKNVPVKLSTTSLKAKGMLHECNHCEYTVTRKETLKRHIQYEHEGAEWKDKCDICSKRFKYREALTVHIRVDHEKVNLKCEEEGCEAVYLSRTGLRLHKDNVHRRKEYFCTECDYKSFSQTGVTKHIKVKHLDITYQCEQCDYSTRFKQNLQQHYISKHKIFTEKRSRQSLDSLGEEKPVNSFHECKFCEFIAISSSILKSHMDGKHGEKKKCQQCEKAFKWTRDLDKHINAVHKGIQRKCSHCEYQTNYLQNIKSHMMSVHKISKYKCETCNKLFAGNFDLEIHKSGVHEGRSSKCNLCDYTYESYKAYRHHKKKHRETYTGMDDKFSISRRRPQNRQVKKDTIKKEEKENCNDSIIKIENEKIDLRFACPLCSKDFETPGEMVPHIASHI